ncbi:MAG: DUF3710 domain-containing protein [Propioniciclava sp.]
MVFGRNAGQRDADVAQGDDVVDDTSAEEAVTANAVDEDIRSDGPFDYTEVDLEDDSVDLHAHGMARITYGPLIITQPRDIKVQLQGDPQAKAVYSLLAHHEGSGIEVALFAAPRSGDMAEELREDIIEEASQGAGNAETSPGPFGTEIRRVLPVEGPEGEQLFHVSRIWLVTGPRWLLRGTLMGKAALVEGTNAPADFFVEFFRNIVVRRDDEARSPGELIHLAVPEGVAQG